MDTSGLPNWSEWLETGVLSHNNYLDIFAQTGAVGSIFFIWLLVSIGYMAIKTHVRAENPFEKSYSGVIIALLTGILVIMSFGDWLIPYVYNIGIEGFRTSSIIWLFLGALAPFYKDQEKLATKKREQVI